MAYQKAELHYKLIETVFIVELLFSVYMFCDASPVQELQRVDFSLYASVRYTVLYIHICLLFCVFGEPMWICPGVQGSIQQQTGGNPSQSLCLTRGFAPTVSSVYTNTLGYTALYASMPIP